MFSILSQLFYITTMETHLISTFSLQNLGEGSKYLENRQNDIWKSFAYQPQTCFFLCLSVKHSPYSFLEYTLFHKYKMDYRLNPRFGFFFYG